MNTLAKTDIDVIAKYEEMVPWQQMDGESILHYSRFNFYLREGPGRTLAQAHEKSGEDGVVSTWYYVYAKYSWRNRAEAWDEYQIALDHAVYERERREWREHRRKMLADMRGSVDLALEQMKKKLEQDDEDNDITMSQLIRIVQTALAETRIEFGDTDIAPNTQINIDNKKKIQITVMEVVKDYGKGENAEIVDGDFEKVDA